MKSPLWMLNSILIVLVFGMIGFIIWSWNNIKLSPTVVSVKPLRRAEPLKHYTIKQQDLQYIYKTNDLFKTFKEEPIALTPVQQLPSIPTPPSPKPITPSTKPVVQFLEPLPIKLTGVTAHSIESKSHATILNTNTKQTKSYRIGDKLFDAYVIRIFPRKVILIRSNGQQEVIYLYAEDAQEEIDALKGISWNNVVQKTSETSYTINNIAFIERITSLAKLIESLDATTAIKNGESIGVRIGKMNKNSIGYALGFEPGDIITSIDNIEPTTTNNRIIIFNNLKQVATTNKPINVDFMRNNRKYTLNYTITNHDNPKTFKEENSKKEELIKAKPAEVQMNKPLPEAPKKDIKKLNLSELEQINKQYAQSNTIKRLRQREQYAMKQFGKRNSVIRHNSPLKTKLRDAHEETTV